MAPIKEPKSTDSNSAASSTTTAADAHNNEEPPPYPEPAKPSFAKKLKAWIGRTRLSHVWFLVWNFAAVVLAICVLNGSGSSTTTSHSLIKSEGRTLAMMLGGESCDFCNLQKSPTCTFWVYQVRAENEGVQRMVGTNKNLLPGACKTNNGTTSCSKAFPFSFNLASVVLKDIGNFTTGEPFENEYKEFTYGKDISHDTVGRIAIALGSLLIVSVLIGVGCIAIAVSRTSGFSETLLFPLVLDAAIHIACLGLYLSILVYEVLGNYSGITMSETPLTAFVGVGAWLWVAMFVCRIISHPLLTVGFLCLCVFLMLLPLCIVGGILVTCCCSSSSTRSTSYSTSHELMTQRPQSQFMVAVEATDVEVEERKDGTVFTRFKNFNALVTNL